MGECSRCGKCCQGLTIPVKNLSPEMRDYLSTRGLVIDKGYFLVPTNCQHLHFVWKDKPDQDCTLDFMKKELMDAGQVIAICDIYENRPKVCRLKQGGRGFGTTAYVPDGCTLVD